MIQKNINDIKELGFKDIDFSGYGGVGFEKDNLQIWIGEWGIATIEKIINGRQMNCVRLGDATKEILKESIIEQINILNSIF